MSIKTDNRNYCHTPRYGKTILPKKNCRLICYADLYKKKKYMKCFTHS